MKKRQGLVWLAIAVLTVVSVVSWYRRHHAEPTPARDRDVPRYLYCPVCGLEMTCPPDFEGEKALCPRCAVANRMVVSNRARGTGDPPSLGINRFFVVLAFAVPIGLAIAVYMRTRGRTVGEPEPEREIQQFSCTGCGHKMMSRSYFPGSVAICPVCKEQFTVPDEEGEEADDKTGKRVVYRPERIKKKLKRERRKNK